MGSPYAGEERRRFKRTPVSFTVFYKVNSPVEIRIKVQDKEFIALAADISEGGIAILTDSEVPPVSVITVKFVMLDDKAHSTDKRSNSITVQGEVRYNLATREGREYRMGISFLNLSAESRRFIYNFIAANKL